MTSLNVNQDGFIHLVWKHKDTKKPPTNTLHTYFKRTAGLIILSVWFWQCSSWDVFCWKVTLIRLMQSFALVQVLFVVTSCYNCLILTKRIIRLLCRSSTASMCFLYVQFCDSALYCLLFFHHEVDIPEWLPQWFYKNYRGPRVLLFVGWGWFFFFCLAMHWTGS